jgi:Fic family protein
MRIRWGTRPHLHSVMLKSLGIISVLTIIRLNGYTCSMIFKAPQPTPELQERLHELDQLRRKLGEDVGHPQPWMGTLRRLVRATSVESSTSIEGFEVPEDDAVALVSGAKAAPAEDESRMAVACYARAMDHVGTMAIDPSFRWLDRVILDLHFDACLFQRDKSPGLWRTDPIGVTGADGLLYQAPPAEEVPGLVDEVVESLAAGDPESHVVIRAAMAHLNVVSVHPFRDGNGRISRIVQSLVLAREGLLSWEFASIEEYLGDHTSEYYGALREVQAGSYQPERDASEWVAFCVDAHLAQARKRLSQIEEAAARWTFLEELAKRRDWPERLVIALEQSLIGGADRTSYSTEAEVSLATASADFRRLRDSSLVKQTGRGRSIRYHASEELRSQVDRAIADGTGKRKRARQDSNL